MALTVYGAPLSPFVRKVLWYAQERALAYEHKVVMPFGLQPEWYYGISPLGKIPAIKDDDFCLADSSLICAYLSEAYPEGASLYPQGAKALANTRWLERYADETVADAATFGLYANRVIAPMMGRHGDEERIQAALVKLPQLFDYLEKALGSADYFVNNAFSVADIAITTHWLSLHYAGVSIDAARWPALAAHFERMRARSILKGLLAKEQVMMAKLKSQPA